MKITITHYGNCASYEFANEDVTLEDLLYHLQKLLELTGFGIDGSLEIVNESE